MTRNLILSVVFAASFILLLLGIFLPFYRQVGNTRSAITEIQQEIINKQNLIAVLEELEHQFGSLQESVEQVAVAVPDEEQLPELLVALPLLLSQNGLALNDIDFGKPISEGTYQSLDINLVASGSYLNIQRFLRALEQNLRIIDVTDINFSRSQAENIYNINLSLKTYFR